MTAAEPGYLDRVVWRQELPKVLGGVSTATVSRYIREGKLGQPDVDLSQRQRGWKLSTLRARGIDVVA